MAQEATRIFYVLKTLLQTPLRMVKVTKCMRHSSIPLYRDLVSTLSQQFSIKLSFVSFQIELCGDDVCRRQILERRCQHWGTYPVVERFPLLHCHPISSRFVNNCEVFVTYLNHLQANTSGTIVHGREAPTVHRGTNAHLGTDNWTNRVPALSHNTAYPLQVRSSCEV